MHAYIIATGHPIHLSIFVLLLLLYLLLQAERRGTLVNCFCLVERDAYSPAFAIRVFDSYHNQLPSLFLILSCHISKRERGTRIGRTYVCVSVTDSPRNTPINQRHHFLHTLAFAVPHHNLNLPASCTTYCTYPLLFFISIHCVVQEQLFSSLSRVKEG